MIDLFSLTGKRALVTGGAQGLGRMIAEGLLRAGAAVAVTSRRAEAVDQAVHEMALLGDCTGYTADLSTPDGVRALADLYRRDHATLDILVNNAGKTWGATLESFPDRAWASVMSVNVQTPFTLVQALLPVLVQSGSGSDPTRVIMIGSIAGKVVEPIGAYSYVASKAAIHQLTRQLAADLAGQGITVNAVVPGYFPTAMTAHLRDDEDRPTGTLAGHIPLGRLGNRDDVAGAVIFLASRAGSYLTGTELIVDGGVTACR